MKRFACRDVIPGCDQVFTGADDQSVLDQVIAHAAMDHGLVKPPLALVELVVATTHTFVPVRAKGHLRLVGDRVTDLVPPQCQEDHVGAAGAERDHLVSPIPTQAGAGRSTVVTMASERFRPAEASWTPSAQVLHTPIQDVEPNPSGYRHECVPYSGLADFQATVLPFLQAGLELDQPIMVAVAEPRLSAIRLALGDAAARVQFADMAEMGHNPARILPAWREFTERSGGRPMRGVGEPIWAGRRNAEVVESQLHEALLNIAVDPTTPLWLVCPYDVDALDPAVIAEARRSHPFVASDGVDEPPFGPDNLSRESDAAGDAGDDHRDDPAGFGGDEHLMSLFEAELPRPTGPPADLPAADPDALADGVLQYAAMAGLTGQQSARLATAIGEIACASARASKDSVSVRIWRDESALVCEVGDGGLVTDPMIGRGTGFAAQSRDRGIRLANELCDLVQVRSRAGGTTVRVHSWL